MKLPFRSKKKEQLQEGQVVTFIDYRNVFEGVKGIGKYFPDKKLKSLGRKYGIGLPPRVYISHTVHFTTAMSLGRRGYVIVFCPPVKMNGPDTTDERIHEECELLAGHPEIKTFVIVSNDAGDFQKTEDLLKNHHKKVVRFYLDDESGILRYTDGDEIPLPDYTKEEQLFFEKNGFVEIVERINKGEKDSLDRDKVHFLRQIIEACEKIYRMGEMNPPDPLSFGPLKTLVWDLIYRHVRGKFYHNDCHQALHALLNHSDVILKKEQTARPRRYYLYNPKHIFPIN